MLEDKNDVNTIVMIINVYMPHRKRKCKPFYEDTLRQLESLVQSNSNEHVIICGDFNASLGRNEEKATGAYANRKHTIIDEDHMNERNMLGFMRRCSMWAVSTTFRPRLLLDQGGSVRRRTLAKASQSQSEKIIVYYVCVFNGDLTRTIAVPAP